MVERHEVDQTIRFIGRDWTLTRHSEARRRPHRVFGRAISCVPSMIDSLECREGGVGEREGQGGAVAEPPEAMRAAVSWKQWKRGRTRFAELRRRGVGRDLAAQTAARLAFPRAHQTE